MNSEVPPDSPDEIQSAIAVEPPANNAEPAAPQPSLAEQLENSSTQEAKPNEANEEAKAPEPVMEKAEEETEEQRLEAARARIGEPIYWRDPKGKKHKLRPFAFSDQETFGAVRTMTSQSLTDVALLLVYLLIMPKKTQRKLWRKSQWGTNFARLHECTADYVGEIKDLLEPVQGIHDSLLAESEELPELQGRVTTILNGILTDLIGADRILLHCPLADAFEDWKDETFQSANELIQDPNDPENFLAISDEIFLRFNAAQTREVDADTESDDEKKP